MSVCNIIPFMKKIILASSSPRRRDLLTMVGADLEVIPSDCDEKISADSPEELVLKLSERKCKDVAGRVSEDCLVVGADTVVVYDGQILGKPEDGTDALNMLKRLNGNTHVVYTGVTVIDPSDGHKAVFAEHTLVTMYNVSDEDLRKYVETEEPLDKAGAYGIQGKGAFLVEKIDGDYYTVVGLPVAKLLKVIREEFK